MPVLPSLPSIASAPLSVVLLTQNQASCLEQVLADWVTFLNRLDREYELILIDDGSTDATATLAAKLASSQPRVQFLQHAAARGDGAALRTALGAARHPLLFYTRCDPLYQPADLGRLLQKRSDPRRAELEIDHVHILSAARGGRPFPPAWRVVSLLWRGGCRLLLGQAPERSPGWLGWRRSLARWLVRQLFGVRYHDVFCPFRLHRRDILARLPLQSDGSFVHVEILAKANYLGLIMGEEVSLEPGHYPPLAGKPTPEEHRQILADARRVICHPDFRPTIPAHETPAPENSGPR
jgi:dolichol-phosphate mannosyltransferase